MPWRRSGAEDLGRDWYGPPGAAALQLAEWGWPVFPCNPNNLSGRKGKEPLIPDGFKQATNDAEQVRRWWERFPKALIGMVPGPAGLLVVDLDPGEGETPADVLARLEEKLGVRLPPVPRQDAVGRLAPLLRQAEGVTIGNSKPMPDIDIRCDNGYVIVPPSRMANGNAYLWDVPFEGELVAPPVELVELIVRRAAAPPADGRETAAGAIYSEDAGDVAVRRYARGALEKAATQMAGTPAGGRGTALNATAFSARSLCRGRRTERTRGIRGAAGRGGYLRPHPRGWRQGARCQDQARARGGSARTWRDTGAPGADRRRGEDQAAQSGWPGVAAAHRTGLRGVSATLGRQRSPRPRRRPHAP